MAYGNGQPAITATSDSYSIDCVENYFRWLENHCQKNTDLIEHSTIDERIAVVGFMTPEIPQNKGVQIVFQHNSIIKWPLKLLYA